jgi:hypothetical protein
MAVSQAEYDRVKKQNGTFRKERRDALDEVTAAEEEAVYRAEERSEGRRSAVKRGGLRFLSDTLSDAGSVGAGFLGNVELPLEIGGESIAMGVGFIARGARPFVRPLGLMDQILSPGYGLWGGGMAVKIYKRRAAKKAATAAAA